jgi:polysaccharide pyruvyl transferase WcaK-like protein
MNIGIVGPIGSYDIGDWALLQSNIQELGEENTYTIFSYDKVKTTNIVEKIKIKERVKEIVDISSLNGECKYERAANIKVENIKKEIKNKIDNTRHLLVTGGAYLNSAWGEDFLPITKLIDVYQQLGISITMSGLNIGPLQKKELKYLSKVFSKNSKIKEVTLRSNNQSEVEDAKSIGLNKTTVTCDDASFLEKDENSPVKNEDKLLVVNLHPTNIFENRNITNKISGLLDEFNKAGYGIVLLPMHYNPNKDLDTLTRVKNNMSTEGVVVYDTLSTPNPKKNKKTNI